MFLDCFGMVVDKQLGCQVLCVWTLGLEEGEIVGTWRRERERERERERIKQKYTVMTKVALYLSSKVFSHVLLRENHQKLSESSSTRLDLPPPPTRNGHCLQG